MNMDENSNSQGSSDSVEVSCTDSSPIMNGHMEMDQYSDDDNGVPSLVILEQPQQRGFRFRYECEGPSHGGLQGISSERYRKTVPTVKIRNYHGAARVTVELVTDDPAPKPHAHKLVGKNCVNGKCIIEVKPGTSQISFPSLCIQHVTKKKSAEVLESRIGESIIQQKQLKHNDLNMKIELSDEEKQRARQQAVSDAKNMALNVVRLCFQAILYTPQGYKLLRSQVSDPIYDSKAPGANALKICRMDKYSGCCTGNDEVFLLCEKVQKDDIMVRFVEQDLDGRITWEAYGHFGPFDVHRQFAIVFKTPEYRDTNINTPVNVLVMLQRKSDKETSDPKSFTYYPRSIDIEGIDRKRKKLIPQYPGSGGPGPGPDIRYGGGDSSNSNGGGAVNGMQNGGGAIPDFNNLKAYSFPHHSSKNIIKSERQRLVEQRNILQAVRRQPSPTTTFSPTANMSMFNNQPTPTDFLSQSTNYIYEEVSKMSPPSQQIDMSPQQQFFPTSPMNAERSTAPTPYSSAGITTGAMSPQQMQVGALSPQHSGLSPQHMQVASPQSNLGSPINMGNANMSAPQTNVTQFGSHVGQASAGITGMHSMQMAPGDLHMSPVSEMQPHTVSHPVQVSNLNEEGLEQDFLAGQDIPVYQYETGNHYQENNSMYGAFPSFNPQQTCAYQARGGLDEDLQDVMNIIGFDEVDASIDVLPHAHDANPYASPVAHKEHLVTGQTSTDHLSKKMADLTVNQEPALKYTAKIHNEYTAKPAVSIEAKVTQKTSVEIKATQTSEDGAQTEMDPMLKLAMKTSQALQYYAMSGDVRSLLMVQRFLMVIQDQDGDLPLHTSLINMKYEVFQNILDVMVTLPDAYARINAYNFHHQTPLHLAVITNQPAAVDLLIRARADTTLVDRNGYTPAHLAVLYDRVDCLKNLMSYLRKGVTATEPFPELNVRCYDGFTPAHLAAQLENLAAMKLLVHGKADINLPDGKSGRTPLHHSVETDDLSLAAYLILQAAADVNVKRFDGNTALHIACGRGNVGMVALLMAGGADPSIENDDVIILADVSDSESEKSDNESKEKESAASDEKDKDTAEEKEEVKGQTEGEGQSQEGRATSPAGSESSESSEEVEPSKRGPVRGMVPADFAGNNEKILRVLNGEPYSSLKSSDDENTEDKDSVYHTGEKYLSTSVESGLGSLVIKSTSGDLTRVDYQTRLTLSCLLDTRDWKALAEKLRLNKLIKDQESGGSPTRLLLDCYEAEGGTVVGLIQALRDIKREDCVTLVTHAVLPQLTETVVPACEEKHLLHKDERADSGMEDSINKSASPSPVHSPQQTT